MTTTKPTLLSPVQDLTSLHAAIDAGCDAVYFGIKGLNMRAGAKNFELKDLNKITKICHKGNKYNKDIKTFLAINVLIYDDEIKDIEKILSSAKKASIDAIIAWDQAVIQKAKKIGLEVHLSTQASISNFDAAKFYYKQGIRQIILARELSLKQVNMIKKRIKKEKLNLKIETFIHGAMCVSVSGRCFLSQELFNKSANRGECLQPCRRKYLVKDPEENHELVIGEDYVLSPNDLCTIDIIEELIEAGIDCFKIEGRNRSPEYVKTTTACYRVAIDLYHELKKSAKDKKTKIRLPQELKQELKERLMMVYNRGFSTGFFMGKPIDKWSKSYGSKATTRKEYIGKIKNFYSKIDVGEIIMESGNIKVGDTLMIQGPTTGVKGLKIKEMQIDKKKVDKGNKGQVIGVRLDFKARINDKVYIIKKQK